MASAENDGVVGDARRHPYRWVLFSGVCGVYLAFGVVAMSIPPLVGEVRDDLDLSRSAMGVALGAWQLVYLVSAPIGGRLLDRLGIHWGLLLGSAVVAASGFARAAADGLGSLWLAIALFGVGGPLISAGAPKAVGLWFGDERERRLAVGVYSTMPAIGGMFTLVLSNTVLMPLTGSWRTTVVVESLAIVVAGLAWLVVSGRAPEAPVAVHADDVAAAAGRRELLASAEVRLVLVLGLGAFFVGHGLGGWMPQALRSHSGFSAMAAANWVAVGGLVGVAASLLVPKRTDLPKLPSRLGALVAAIGLAMVAVLFLPTFADPVPVAVAGLRAALVPLVLIALLESEQVTPANTGVATGLWFAVAELGGVTGPLVLGWVADSSAGFTGAFLVVAGVCALMLVPVARLRRFTG
ncbi:MAG: MFS transporter [Actinomycetota bacterium]|nr:MFS transporter [Actinomycetota bacterium]MEE2958929.1 MFS transporter [Actinomycetota bacterium]